MANKKQSKDKEFHQLDEDIAEESGESYFDSHFNETAEDREKGESFSGLLGEGLKKLIATGVSAAFMTEESIRKNLHDLKLPKEVLNLILQGASKSKEQLTNRVANEVIGIISKIDFVKEASRFVENHKFKISAEIEITKRESGSSGLETKLDIKDKS